MKHRSLITALTAGLIVCSAALVFAAEVKALPKTPGPDQGVYSGHGTEETKKIIAKVNGTDIPEESLLRMTTQISAREKRPAKTPEEISALREEALKRLIFQELVYQKAKAEGLTTDQKTIDESVSELRLKLGGEEAYRKFIEDEKITEEDLRGQIDRSLTLQRMYATEVTGKVTIPEEDLKKEYEKQKDKFIRPGKVVVIDVVFFLKTDDPASLSKAEEVLRKLEEDKEKDPWKLVSDGTFVVRDFEVPKDKEETLYNAAKGLQVDELSGIVRTPDSLHIIKLKEYVPEKQSTFEEVKGTLKMKLMVPLQRKRLQEWEQELQKNAKIELFGPVDSEKPEDGSKRE